MQLSGVARSLGAEVRPFHLRQERDWEPDWDEFERAVTPGTRLLYLSNPNNPDRLGAVGRGDAAHRRSLRTDRDVAARRRGVSRRGDRPAAHRQLLGDGRSRDRRPAACRRRTAFPASGSAGSSGRETSSRSAGASTTTSPSARTRCRTGSRGPWSSRTTASGATPARAKILRHNLPIAREWVAGFDGRLTWREPQAGAIALVKYEGAMPSLDVAERVRTGRAR